MLITIIGVIGSLTTVVMFMPQVIKIFHMRQNKKQITGISLTSQLLSLSNTVLWGIYGLLTKDVWVALPSLINGPLAIYMSIAVWRSSRIRQAKIYYHNCSNCDNAQSKYGPYSPCVGCLYLGPPNLDNKWMREGERQHKS